MPQHAEENFQTKNKNDGLGWQPSLFGIKENYKDRLKKIVLILTCPISVIQFDREFMISLVSIGMVVSETGRHRICNILYLIVG